MDVRRLSRVARAALQKLVDWGNTLAVRLIASERPADQISREHESYFRSKRVEDRDG